MFRVRNVESSQAEALRYKYKMEQRRDDIELPFHSCYGRKLSSFSSYGDTQTCRIQNEIPPSSVHIHADTKLKSDVKEIRGWEGKGSVIRSVYGKPKLRRQKGWLETNL